MKVNGVIDDKTNRVEKITFKADSFGDEMFLTRMLDLIQQQSFQVEGLTFERPEESDGE